MTYQNSSNNRDINQPVNTQSGTTYVALLSDTIIAMSNVAARQVTLPAPSASGITSTVGKVYTVKDVAGTAATANITVTPAGGFIDGGTEVLIATNYGSASFYSDGVAWYSQAANYAAGVSLAYASWQFSQSTASTVGATIATGTSTTVAFASSARIAFSSLGLIQSNNLTIGTNTITIDQSGNYSIDANFDTQINNATVVIQLIKNGSVITSAYCSFGVTADASLPFAVNFPFVAGDVIDFRVGSNNPGSVAGFRTVHITVAQQPTSAIPSLAGNTPTNNIITVTSGMSPFTYTPSANLQYAVVEVVGSGGGGGGSGSGSATQSSAGAGGGAGGYARATLSPFQIGASQTVTIGTAGSGGVGAASGTSGNSCSFGSLVIPFIKNNF